MQLDSLIREALGRDQLDRSLFDQFSLDNLELPLNSPAGSLFPHGAPHFDLNPSCSSEESSQITAQDMQDKSGKDDLFLNMTLESLAKQFELCKEEVQSQGAGGELELDTSPPTLRVAPIPTPTAVSAASAANSAAAPSLLSVSPTLFQ